MRVEVRPTVPDDLAAFNSDLPPVRARAWTGLIDGEVVAIGGYWYLATTGPMAFLNIKPGAAKRGAVTLMKTARVVFADAKARGFTVIRAQADEDNKLAKRFLERLGFTICAADYSIYERGL